MIGKVLVAFSTGFLSIAFPCVLPLVPGYLSAVSAVEAPRLGQPGVSRRVAVASLPFILGFTVVFVALGAAATAIADVLDDQARQAVAGFVLVVAGLAFAGLLPWTERLAAPGLLGSARRSRSRFLLGGAFAVCAAPCVGPLLGGALALLVIAVFFMRGMAAFRWMRDHYRVFSIAGGAVLVGLGLLLFFDQFWRVQAYVHRALEAIGLGDI
jgi:cytochrome c-type biogenesis protein